jgi:hypothetical protein
MNNTGSRVGQSEQAVQEHAPMRPTVIYLKCIPRRVLLQRKYPQAHWTGAPGPVRVPRIGHPLRAARLACQALVRRSPGKFTAR